MALSPYLSNCVTKIESESGRCSRFTYAVASCQGWRTAQEDAHLAIVDMEQNTSIFAVFDGHNGPEVAKFVSKHLPKQLLKNASYRRGFIERGLQESFMALDEILISKESNDLLLHYRDKLGYKCHSFGNEHPLAYFTGCTAVVLLIKNDIYYCANIGDSRCIVSRDGRAKQLSKDHKPEHSDERARIERAGGSVINGRINLGIDVSRSFGDHWYKRNSKLDAKQQMMSAWPHTTVEKLQNVDQFIVLCCDGIWNSMDNQELIEYIYKRLATMPESTDLAQWLTKICEQVIKNILPVGTMPKLGIAGKDNMTIMIIRRTAFTGSESSLTNKTSNSESRRKSIQTVDAKPQTSRKGSMNSQQPQPQQTGGELSLKALKSSQQTTTTTVTQIKTPANNNHSERSPKKSSKKDK